MATPTYPILILKPERDWPLKNHHHAIYKNAVAKVEDGKNGMIVEVRSSAGEFLCYATWNVHAFICGRAIAFEKGDPEASLGEATPPQRNRIDPLDMDGVWRSHVVA